MEGSPIDIRMNQKWYRISNQIQTLARTLQSKGLVESLENFLILTILRLTMRNNVVGEQRKSLQSFHWQRLTIYHRIEKPNSKTLSLKCGRKHKIVHYWCLNSNKYFYSGTMKLIKI